MRPTVRVTLCGDRLGSEVEAELVDVVNDVAVTDDAC